MPTKQTPTAPSATEQSGDAAVSARGRRRWRLGLMSGVGVLVAGGLVWFGIALEPFASAKTLLLKAVSSNSAAPADGASQETWRLQLKNLSAPLLPPAEQNLIQTLNGSTLQLSLDIDVAKKLCVMRLNTSSGTNSHQGALWVSSDRAILSIADYAALLKPFLPNGTKIPPYLITDTSQTPSVHALWSQLNPQTTSTVKANASRMLLQLMVEGLPADRVTRTGLTGIEIQFDQSTLETLIKSEIHEIYSNKGTFADAIAELSAPAGVDSQTVSQQSASIVNQLDQIPESSLTQTVSSLFQAHVLSVQPSSIDFHRNLFSGTLTEHAIGGFSVRDPQNHTGGTVEFDVQSTNQAPQDIVLPTTTSANSKTFQQFLQ